jgi:hypothetical protein
LGTFRESDFLSSDQGEMIRKHILKICGDLKKYAVPLVDTF